MSSVSAGRAPAAFHDLPGVQQLVESGSVKVPSQAELAKEEVRAAEVRSSEAVRSVVTAQERAAVQADLAQNQQLVQAMNTLNVVPTVDGVTRVMGAAKRAPASFTNMLGATQTAALTLGKSEGANREMGDAMANFALNGNVRATDMGDMSYVLARVVVESQSTERDATLNAIQESIRANEQMIKELEAERDRLQEMDGSKVSKQDVQTNDDGSKVAVIDGQQYDVAQDNKSSGTGGIADAGKTGGMTIDTSNQVASLNARIDALKDSTKVLREVQAKQEASSAKQPEQSYEPVFFIVEKAQNIAQYKAFNTAGIPGQQ